MSGSEVRSPGWAVSTLLHFVARPGNGVGVGMGLCSEYHNQPLEQESQVRTPLSVNIYSNCVSGMQCNLIIISPTHKVILVQFSVHSVCGDIVTE